MSEQAVPAERLERYVTPLDTTDPDAELDDLDSLVDQLSDASVVGMGEATHGTREFFQLKHRLLRLMVEELGCRVFAIEANFSETLAINDYVVHGEGDPKEALDGIYFWTWNTEAVLAMIEWMRGFNADRPVDDRIRFYGFDAQFPMGPAAALAEFLEDVDPEFAATVADDLDLLADGDVQGEEVSVAEAHQDTAAELVENLRSGFEARGDEWADRRSESAVELARQHLRTLDQVRRLAVSVSDADDPREGYWVRDEAMAENVAWIREHESADVVAAWAHNGHVLRGATEGGWEAYDPMGAHLADRFGGEYYPLAFDFSRGSFRAVEDTDAVSEPELREFEVDAGEDPTVSAESGADGGDADGPEEGASDGETETDGAATDSDATGDDADSNATSDDADDSGPDTGSVPDTTVNDALAGLPGNVHFLDLASAVADPDLADWLDRPHSCRHIGAVVFDEESQFIEYRLPGEADGLLFVTETTAARGVDDETGD